jgi:hypothetical protein
MRLRSMLREEELKKRGKLPPTRFQIISAAERNHLPSGMKSYVVPSLSLETARLARAEAAKSMGKPGTLARQVPIVVFLTIGLPVDNPRSARRIL